MSREELIREIKAGLDALVIPGCVYEVRIPKIRKGTYGYGAAGYFSDFDAMAKAIATYDTMQGGVKVDAIYATLNPVDDDLLARANNRIMEKPASTSTDQDVACYRSILIDCDPVRKSGISSTDEELQQSLALRDEIVGWLARAGFPEPVTAMSGNGAHARYLVDFAVTQETTETVQRFLKTLAQRFDNERVTVDTGVFNPSRICKVYGTVSRKGDSTEQRPHRRSYLESVPETYQDVPYDLLREIAALYEPEEPVQQPAKPTTRRNSNGVLQPLDVPAFLATHRIECDKEKHDSRGRTIWRLTTCPFCGESDKSAVVTQDKDGKVGFKCQHNRCQGKDWDAFRSFYEPDYKNRRTPGQTQDVRDDTRDARDRARKRIQSHGRMIDITHENLGRVTHEVWDAMLQSQYAELLFVYGGGIIIRENGQITFIDETIWRGLINRVCSFWRDSKREGLREVIPPISTVRDTMRFRPDGIRTIERIVSLPVLDKHGTLLGSGYHKDAAILSTSTLEPVAMDANTAYSLLFDEMLVDFPFADECSLSNAIALLFLPFVREMVGGATPLHLIDGNKWGTGKGLLNDLFHIIWTGTPAHVTDLPLNDEEQRKSITTHLMQAPLSVTFDDISWLGGRAIQRALTGQIYEDRILGQNNKTVLPVRNIWIATGNNVTIAGDMPRRVVLIRLETPHEFPGQRSDTQRTESSLRLWVRENRQQLVSACITLIRHGLAHGHTDETLKMGGFDEYVRVLSKILNGCGLSGFLKNMDIVHERMDDRQSDWKLVVRKWYDEYGTTEVRASDIVKIIESDENCGIALNGETDKSKQTSAGTYLKKILGTVFNFEVPADEATTETVRVKIAANRNQKGHRVYRLVCFDGNSALESHRRPSRPSRPSSCHSVRGTQPELACVSAHDMTGHTSATSARSAMALQSGKTHIRGGYTFTVESRTLRFGGSQYAATLEGTTAHGGWSDSVEESIQKAARCAGIVLGTEADDNTRSAGCGEAGASWCAPRAPSQLPLIQAGFSSRFNWIERPRSQQRRRVRGPRIGATQQAFWHDATPPWLDEIADFYLDFPTCDEMLAIAAIPDSAWDDDGDDGDWTLPTPTYLPAHIVRPMVMAAA